MNLLSNGPFVVENDHASGYSATQLCELLRREEHWVTDTWFAELLNYGVLARDCAEGQLFSSNQLEKAHMAAKLHRELSIKPAGIALALQLLDRIVVLESRLTDLKILLAWQAEPDSNYYYH